MDNNIQMKLYSPECNCRDINRQMKLYSPGCIDNNKQMKLYSPGYIDNNRQMKMYYPKCREITNKWRCIPLSEGPITDT